MRQPRYEFGGIEIVVRALIVSLLVLHRVKAKKRVCQEQQTITDVRLRISYAEDKLPGVPPCVVIVDTAIANKVPNEFAELFGRAVWIPDGRRTKVGNTLRIRKPVIGAVWIGVRL